MAQGYPGMSVYFFAQIIPQSSNIMQDDLIPLDIDYIFPLQLGQDPGQGFRFY